MLTATKNLTVIALILAFATPAAARVTPAHKYNQKITSIEEPSASCSAYGWHDTEVTNADCKPQSLGGKTCYACKCNTTKYPFESCPTEAFNRGASCSIDGKTYYETCTCKAPYRPASDFVNTSTFSATTPSYAIAADDYDGHALETCFNLDVFTGCKSGSFLKKNQIYNLNGSALEVTFTANDDNPFLTYKGKPLLKNINDSDNKFCTSGVTPSSPLYTSTSRPAGSNDCAEFVPGMAKYSPYTKYGYFNGNCSDSDKCVKTTGVDCITYGSSSVTTYNTSSKTPDSVSCSYTQGCQEGISTVGSQTFLCAAGTINASSSYFSSSSKSDGTASCKKIIGCAAGYTLKHLGAINSNDYSKDGTNTYEVQKLTSGTGMIVCTKTSGCAAPLYSKEACYYNDGTNYGPPAQWTAANMGL